jgi:hypothetical protein
MGLESSIASIMFPLPVEVVSRETNKGEELATPPG